MKDIKDIEVMMKSWCFKPLVRLFARIKQEGVDDNYLIHLMALALLMVNQEGVQLNG